MRQSNKKRGLFGFQWMANQVHEQQDKEVLGSGSWWSWWLMAGTGLCNPVSRVTSPLKPLTCATSWGAPECQNARKPKARRRLAISPILRQFAAVINKRSSCHWTALADFQDNGQDVGDSLERKLNWAIVYVYESVSLCVCVSSSTSFWYQMICFQMIWFELTWNQGPSRTPPLCFLISFIFFMAEYMYLYSRWGYYNLIDFLWEDIYRLVG